MKRPDGHIPLVPVSFAIEPDIRKQLKAIARDEDRRLSWVLRDMVIEALKRRDAQATTETTNTVA